MSWEIVVGIETHAQLATRSKIFSGAATAFGAAPNSQACAVDIALPGVLPVLNKSAVECAIRFGLAVQGEVAARSVFARKNYFYPDLPKGYQISQFELPVVRGGQLAIVTPAGTKIVRLVRAHLEEDAGKSLHEDFHGMSGLDFNRAGTPLLEIVTEPDLRGAQEAVSYAKALHTLVRYLEICDGNMQEGSFRCDANVSVRRIGAQLGTRCEIKNLNSFRFLERAIEFEARRQIEILEDGGRIVQETRLYDPDRDETRSMRSKEEAHDYRYFPDPDLLPLEIAPAWIDAVRATMPESPSAKQERFIREHQVTAYDAALLASDKEIAAYFETTVAHAASGAAVGGLGKLSANWINGELSAALNAENLTISQSKVSAAQLGGLLARIQDGTLSSKLGKEVFDALWQGAATADAVIEAKGLRQISDAGALEKIVDDIIAANPAQVAQFKAGKEKVLGFFVGQAMKASAGKANPGQLTDIVKRKLSS